MKNQNKKILLAGAGIGLIALLLSSSKKDSSTSYGTEDPTGNGSITNANAFSAQKIADDLYNICKKTGRASFLNPGQRDEIFSLLKNVSPNQFVQVKQKFGKRAYNRTWNNNYFLIGTDPTYYPLDIILKDELESEDYATLKQKYKNSL